MPVASVALRSLDLGASFLVCFLYIKLVYWLSDSDYYNSKHVGGNWEVFLLLNSHASDQC